MFTLGAEALDRIHQFRDERLRETTSGNRVRSIKGDGRLMLHIVPLAAVTSAWQVDLASVQQMRKAFYPISADTATS